MLVAPFPTNRPDPRPLSFHSNVANAGHLDEPIASRQYAIVRSSPIVVVSGRPLDQRSVKLRAIDILLFNIVTPTGRRELSLNGK